MEYRVQIAPGNIVTVDADSPEQAQEIVKRDILATTTNAAAAPYLDQILFDYETGIKNLSARAKLGLAETVEESDRIARKLFGTDGFTRNSKGQLAVTPEGLERIGETPEYLTLADGSRVGVNRMVDENEWFSAGDFADMSGVAGPVIGAITILSPQAKALQFASNAFKFFGGQRRLRTLLAGLGTAGGKGAEEAYEAAAGLQDQNAKEIAELLAFEAALGAGAQGATEILGAGYGLLLGRNAPIDNVRFNEQALQGRSLIDVMRLDKSLGRQATKKELDDAVKAGKIKLFNENPLPSQAAFERRAAATLQGLSEQVLGQKRVRESKKYLYRGMTQLFDELNGQNTTNEALSSVIDQYGKKVAMSADQKKALDVDIKNVLADVNQAEIAVVKELEKLLDDVVETYTDSSIYAANATRGEIGVEVKNALVKARIGAKMAMRDAYEPVDRMFAQMEDPFISGAIAKKIIIPRVDEAKRLLKELDESDFMPSGLKLGEEVNIKNNPVGYLGQTLDNIKKEAENSIRARANFADQGVEEGFSFTGLRNTLSRLGAEQRFIPDDGLLPDTIDRVIKELDGIFTDLSAKGSLKRPGITLNGLKLTPEDSQLVSMAVEKMRKAHRFSYELLKPFDNLLIRKVKKEAGFGAVDPLDVYKRVFVNGKSGDIRDVFKALRNYDDYIDSLTPGDTKKLGLVANNEMTLRNTIKQKFVSDAFKESFDYSTQTVNFAKFADVFTRFDKSNPGKLTELFNDELAGGDRFLQVLEQVNLLRPTIKAPEVEKLMAAFKNDPSGLKTTKTGTAFIDALENLAEAKFATAKYEANNILRNLPDATTEEVVKKVFSPAGAPSIKLIKETIDPAAFKEIQNNAMNRILKEAINYDGMAQTGDIAKIFNGQKFQRILDSYGQETLEAMFGKDIADGLFNYAKTMRLVTAGEVGTGGGQAGALVGATIALGLLNYEVWPTVMGLAFLQALFMNKFYLRALASTEKGAIGQLADAVVRGSAQIGAQSAADTTEQSINSLQNEIERALPEADDMLRKTIDDIRYPVPEPKESIELPDVEPVSIESPNVGNLSQDPAVRAAILTGGQSIV